jgi:AcrR family transcriptional regulator
MLYHYFGNKEHLFREVLRRKIAERQASAEGLSGDPAESLPFWFKLSCKDADWVRLLEWEALQDADNQLIDGTGRRSLAMRSLGRIRQQQASGHLSGEFEPRHLLLAMRSLTMFPLAFPQLTRLITGQPVSDPHFQKKYAEFLKKFAAAFRPAGGRRNKTNFEN